MPSPFARRPGTPAPELSLIERGTRGANEPHWRRRGGGQIRDTAGEHSNLLDFGLFITNVKYFNLEVVSGQDGYLLVSMSQAIIGFLDRSLISSTRATLKVFKDSSDVTSAQRYRVVPA